MGYTYYLLVQCERKSYTTSERSEMNQWFNEEDPYDPNNNYKKHWNCIHYTAKLASSKGDLFPEVAFTSDFHNDYYKHCDATGRCKHRYMYKETPNSVRYNKCDIGTVRYTNESPM